MGFHEKLRRCLAEVSYLILDGFLHDEIGDRVQFDAALVRQVVKDVRRADSLGSWKVYIRNNTSSDKSR